MPLVFAASGILALSLMGFIGDSDWFLGICASFRVQYIYIALLLVVLSIIRRNRKALLISAIVLLINLPLIWPYYMPLNQLKQVSKGSPQQATQPKSALTSSLLSPPKNQPLTTYTILHSNVFKSNRQRGRVISLIQRTHADIVVLAEVSDSWSKTLKYDPVLLKMYPYQFYDDYDYDLMILSKYKLVHLKVERKIGANVIPPILSTQIQLPTRTISLIQMHVEHATSDYEALLQRLMINHVIDKRKTITDPLIVVGDYNMTPWEHQFQRLGEEAQLTDAALGFGVQPTWPNGFGPFMIPIDHIMTSPDVTIKKIQPMPPVGSDHLPLYATFALKPR